MNVLRKSQGITRTGFSHFIRPESALGALGTGTMEPPTKEECRANARREADAIETLFPTLGMYVWGSLPQAAM